MSGSGWVWLALVPESPPEALAAAPVTGADGRPAGVLAAWPSGPKPVPGVLRCDAAGIDPAGEPAWASYVVVPAELAPLYDDDVVSQSIRTVLQDPAPAGVSTLTRDTSHFAGSLLWIRDEQPDRLRDDPFARIHPPLVLRVGAGLLGAPPTPAGPAGQRYAGKPWPAAGF